MLLLDNGQVNVFRERAPQIFLFLSACKLLIKFGTEIHIEKHGGKESIPPRQPHLEKMKRYLLIKSHFLVEWEHLPNARASMPYWGRSARGRLTKPGLRILSSYEAH